MNSWPSRSASTSSPPRKAASRSRSWTTCRCRSRARRRVDLQMAVGQLTERVVVTAASPAPRNRYQPARPGDYRRADARAGVERPRVLGAGAAGDRRPAVGPEQEQPGHAARRRVQRQRPAEHVQQLPDRRRRQQRLRHQQPGLLEPGDAAAARRGRRVPRRHQQPERRIRPRRRRDRERRLPQRHQPVPRRRLGVLPRHRAQRHDLLQAGRRAEAAAAPQPVRRRARRPDREEQGVLLRRLRRVPPEPESRPRSRRCRPRRRTPAS